MVFSADFVSAVGVFVTSAGAPVVEGLDASVGITETVAEGAGAALEGEGVGGGGVVAGAVCEAAGASVDLSLGVPLGVAGACSGVVGVVTAGGAGASSKILLVVCFVMP